ncbi:prepilin peptidase [Mariniblastus sp.]|nr:prepilin peptidase [Mariniblastus sp.]
MIKALVGFLALAVLLVLFVLPAFSGTLLAADLMPQWLAESMGLLATLQTWVMRLFVIVWVFFVGSCFASFLNVVAWRVPRGRGINGSSHCPHCDVRLSMKDNMPVLGWLRNRGRCRTCKTPITIRYLIVEIALGLLTLGLVSLEVFWGGVNLPVGIGQDFRFALLDNLVGNPKYDLIGIVGFHLVLVFGLFTASVVRSEGLAVPVVIVGVVVAIGVAYAAVWPRAIVLDCFGGTSELSRFSLTWWLTLMIGAIAGSVAGFALDRMVWFNGQYKSVEEIDTQACSPDAMAAASKVWTVADGVAAMPLVGLFLGWQALASVIVLLVLMLPVRRLIRCRACVALQTQVFLATVVHLSCWRILTWVGWF